MVRFSPPSPASRLPLPERILPQLGRAAARPAIGPGWVHELKHDGHLILANLEHGRVRLRSRPGNDATCRFAPLARWLSELKVESAILDGEIAVPVERGVTHIDQLSFAVHHAPERLAYYAFDLLWLDRRDLRRRPLLERKALLQKLLARAPGRVIFSDHFAGDGAVLFRRVGELGGEGIVSKRADAPYTSGPSSTWLKVKHAAVGTFPSSATSPRAGASRRCSWRRSPGAGCGRSAAWSSGVRAC
jgi:bifunctional non-homologous end joining protein LigD